MSAAYTIGGMLLGVLATKASVAEPAWGAMIIPAAISFIVGWTMEHTKS